MGKYFFITLITTILLFLALPSAILAQKNLRSGESIVLGKNEIVTSNYFAGGEKITLSGTVNGDAYLGGGNILVDGKVDGDLIVGGGNINITGIVNGNVRIAGGNIQISGSIGKNITALGGSINLDDSSKIMGSLVTAGGNIQVFAPIPQGITAAGGALTIGNNIGSDVIVAVEDLTLTPSSTVNGNLIYYSNKSADINPGATISGELSHRYPPKTPIDQKEVKKTAGTIVGGFTIFNLLACLLLGVLLLYFFPNFMEKSIQNTIQKPLLVLGLGFLVLIITPFLIVISLITLIGLPLSLILLVGYLIALYLSQIFTSLIIGNRIFKLINQKENKYLALIAGLIILAILTIIPIIGGLIGFISLLLGLGTMILTKYSFYKSLKLKNLL